MSRVQTGVRVEKSLLKVLKALAEYEEVSLGDLLERVVLSSFAGERAFDEEAQGRVVELSRIYGLDLEGPSEPDGSTLPPESDPLSAEEESGLAEAFDGLSRMLGADD